jgi:hypothetical protein
LWVIAPMLLTKQEEPRGGSVALPQANKIYCFRNAPICREDNP